MIRLLDLPGMKAVENRARLNSMTAVRQDHDLESMVDTVIREQFGITSRPALLIIQYQEDEFHRRYSWDEDRGGYVLNPGEVDDDEGEIGLSDVEAWRQVGWDVTGSDGEVMVSLPMLRDAMNCIDFGLEGFSKMEIEAKAWAIRAKAEAPRVTARQSQQNMAFLNLATPRRGRA